jgi:AcrR family transcriptional regulator
MPKLVDHAQRRAEIVDATFRLVAREGLARATMRALASELGVANGAIGHYFKSQDELLWATYEEVFARTNARASQQVRGKRGLDALFAMLREFLPMEPVTIDEARIVVCFWGRVTADPRLLVRLPEEHQAWTWQVQGRLAEAVADEDLQPGLDLAAIAELIVTTVHAMQVRAVTLAELTPPTLQRQLIEQALRPWMRPGTSLANRWPAELLAKTKRTARKAANGSPAA